MLKLNSHSERRKESVNQKHRHAVPIIFGRSEELTFKMFFTIFFFISISTFAQNFETQKLTDKNGYSYETVEGDPLKTRIYTLKNGLKVYLSVYKDEPRIQTYVAIKAGSKSDPATATGLAHYLEHILFKGTSKIGSSDWEHESQLLTEIETLYESYRQTKDSTKRTVIYHQIDSISGVAAKYAIANEYDKLMSNVGASGTNAYTFFEQTVYINDIPANQINKWIEIEAERFGEVVPRLFHTELEAVYEEKNRGVDSDRRKVWESLLEGIFPTHQYGTQTTIGTVEHLQNPSITEIKKYFHKYYVPNNMAICLSGDLDPASTIKTIDEYWGQKEAQPVADFVVAKEKPIQQPIVREVVGPDAENVTLGFRFPGMASKEALMMELVSMILSNSQAGLIDLNLNQQQKVLGAYSYPLRLKDYSIQMLSASPKTGQTLEEARDLLLGQLELIKQGKFDDWLIPAIVNDYKKSQMLEMESNKARATSFVSAFVADIPWAEAVAEIAELEKITKQEVIDFAKTNYKDNYVVVYKRTGVDTTIVRVPKPIITPVEVNREKQSPFYVRLTEEKVDEIKPVFVDFEKDMTFSEFKGLPIHYKANTENTRFNLYYILDMGSRHNKKLSLAVSYLDYLGTDKYSAEDLKKEFYKLGCEYGVMTSDDQVYVSLSGLNKNFDKALELFENFLTNVQPNKEAYEEMVGRILKSRQDAKLNKGTILQKAMLNYVIYGEKSPFTDILSEEELKAIQPQELVNKAKDILNYRHRVLYYGPTSVEDLKKSLKKYHKVLKDLKAYPEKTVYPEKPLEENKVYFVNYDMVQAELLMISRSKPYSETLDIQADLFNEYFGGSMGSIVFQELRESKALAYSVRAQYSTASKPNKSNYVVSYIGSQADKLKQAVDGMIELHQNFKASDVAFANAKDAILSGIETNRTTKTAVLFAYEGAQEFNRDYTLTKPLYEYTQKASLKDIEAFHQAYFKDQTRVFLVIGSKEHVDLEALKAYGEVVELSLEAIFGY